MSNRQKLFLVVWNKTDWALVASAYTKPRLERHAINYENCTYTIVNKTQLRKYNIHTTSCQFLDS